MDLGILISGRGGSNLGAIRTAIDDGKLAARAHLVADNRLDPAALQRLARGTVHTAGRRTIGGPS
jgi:folate-dependent phosphoribosylglycinamide formyltransferase PurN